MGGCAPFDRFRRFSVDKATRVQQLFQTDPKFTPKITKFTAHSCRALPHTQTPRKRCQGVQLGGRPRRLSRVPAPIFLAFATQAPPSSTYQTPTLLPPSYHLVIFLCSPPFPLSLPFLSFYRFLPSQGVCFLQPCSPLVPSFYFFILFEATGRRHHGKLFMIHIVSLALHAVHCGTS